MTTQTSPPSQSPPAAGSAEAESKNHSYIGSAIPWFVRLIWLGFWVLCIWYIMRWLIPSLKLEIVNPP
jgi:hypothetical protein